MRRHIGIIGGGAAGLIAAVATADCGAQVTVLEGGKTVGKKLSATGNGRGNYTNLAVSAKGYHCKDSAFVEKALSCFDQYDALSLFLTLGILPRLRNGYVYPRSEEAAALTAVLHQAAVQRGVRIVTEQKAKQILPKASGFTVVTAEQEYPFDCVILACGGLTAAKTGSDGSGFALAAALGHTVTEPVPALCGLTFPAKHPLGRAAGVRTEAALTLLVNGTPAAVESGELQITENAVSGIPVMQLSYLASRALHKHRETQLLIDLAPDFSEEELAGMLLQYQETAGILPDRLKKALPGDRTKWPRLMKRFPVEITGLRDPDRAQVTCGGVLTKELDAETMASLLCPGLFFAGEMIDVDGRCGGYNLQWAWTSGVLAAYGACGKKYIHHEPAQRLLDLLARAELADRRK